MPYADWKRAKGWKVKPDAANIWSLTSGEILVFEGEGGGGETDKLTRKNTAVTPNTVGTEWKSLTFDKVEVKHGGVWYTVTSDDIPTLTCTPKKGSGGIPWTAVEGG